MPNLVARIKAFNQGRDPQLIQLKYKAMRPDVFAFYRGTCHLFYENWPANTSLDNAPPVWVCGDLHIQNLGSYKADNRLVYFNINDFDESALAPCTWDLARFLTCLLVSARTLDITEGNAIELCKLFLDDYTHTLVKGHIGMIEENEVVGAVRDLIFQVKARRRTAFLDSKTQRVGEARKLIIDGKHYTPITEAERTTITSVIEQWGTNQADPQFFKVLDAAHRIAGVGSLGISRYAVLVEGKGSPDYNYLLDIKEEPYSSLQPYLKLHQPRWDSQTERVVSIQSRVQEMPPALLSTVESGGKYYVLRELQPIEDKIHLEQMGGELARWEEVVTMIAMVVAWDQLHSGGYLGAATASDLMNFAKATHWWYALLTYAQYYATQVDEDYRAFCTAFDKGDFLL